MAGKVHGVMQDTKQVQFVATQAEDKHMSRPSDALVRRRVRSGVPGVVEPDPFWDSVRPCNAWPLRIIGNVGDRLLQQESVALLSLRAELGAAGG
jgi:hypothetical protein